MLQPPRHFRRSALRRHISAGLLRQVALRRLRPFWLYFRFLRHCYFRHSIAITTPYTQLHMML